MRTTEQTPTQVIERLERKHAAVLDEFDVDGLARLDWLQDHAEVRRPEDLDESEVEGEAPGGYYVGDDESPYAHSVRFETRAEAEAAMERLAAVPADDIWAAEEAEWGS